MAKKTFDPMPLILVGAVALAGYSAYKSGLFGTPAAYRQLAQIYRTPMGNLQAAPAMRALPAPGNVPMGYLAAQAYHPAAGVPKVSISTTNPCDGSQILASRV